MPRVHHEGRRLDLGPADFVAAGGEGDVYARGSVAFKLPRDPARVLPQAKLDELTRIGDERVLVPRALVTEGAKVVGHAMPFLAHGRPLAQLFPPAFKRREGLDSARVAALAVQLAERVRAVHAAGCTIVDLNEHNVLVDADLRHVYTVDCDSYQTPSFPATALAPTIADPAATSFDARSDWFSFAVISFQLFTGIHPYRGHHPRLRHLSARLRERVSVLCPEVRVPPTVPSFDVIPEAWRGWYREVLEGARRTPPPALGRWSAPSIARPRPAMAPRVVLEPRGQLPGPVRALRGRPGRAWALTGEGLYEVTGSSAPRRVAEAPPRAHLALTPEGASVLAWLEPRLRLLDATNGVELASDLEPDTLFTDTRGGLYGRCGARIVELALHSLGHRVVSSPRTALLLSAPHASATHDGLVVQRPFGATHLALLTAPGRCTSLRVPELDGLRLLEARARPGLAILRTEDRAGAERGWRLFTAEGRYHLEASDQEDRGLATLPRGIAVVDTSDGLDVTTLGLDRRRRRRLAGALAADDLVALGDEVWCTSDRRLYRVVTRDHASAASAP